MSALVDLYALIVFDTQVRNRVCFHMTKFVYDSVRGLENEYRRNFK